MRGVLLLEDCGIFQCNVIDAKTAHQISIEYEEINRKVYIKENLKRWKKEFKKSLDSAIKDGKFKCAVNIPSEITSVWIDDPKEDFYGSEIFMAWLKEKGYQVRISSSWFIINW